MSLKEELQSDLHQAMRSRDRVRVSVLRMLRSAIGYEEIDKKREMDDPAILDIISPPGPPATRKHPDVQGRQSSGARRQRDQGA